MEYLLMMICFFRIRCWLHGLVFRVNTTNEQYPVSEWCDNQHDLENFPPSHAKAAENNIYDDEGDFRHVNK